MAYYIDVFSPETYEKFSTSDKSIAGFTQNKKGMAATVQPGDKLICYVTRVSRWVGLLEFQEGPFTDDTPRFTDDVDPYSLRFKVKPLSWLPLEQAIPVSNDQSWNHLSFTKELPKNSSRWTIMVRSSLRQLNNEDGAHLESLLLSQQSAKQAFPLDEKERKALKSLTVKTPDSRQVPVSIPVDDKELPSTGVQQPAIRESIKIQALLAQIGERMNLKIWVPRNDKQRILENWTPQDGTLLQQLPLNYDSATLKTIENIDVLWIRGRSIVRAFEVEHTTSIYSGILRMADLMALQPNLNIIAHIVAPDDRREKVFEELTRPVFTYLEKGPLWKSCSFLSYDSIRELSGLALLEYMADAVLDQFAEYAEEEEV